MRGPSRRHLEEERVAAVKVRVGVERSNVPGPYCLAGTVPRQSQPARPRPLPKPEDFGRGVQGGGKLQVKVLVYQVKACRVPEWSARARLRQSPPPPPRATPNSKGLLGECQKLKAHGPLLPGAAAGRWARRGTTLSGTSQAPGARMDTRSQSAPPASTLSPRSAASGPSSGTGPGPTSDSWPRPPPQAPAAPAAASQPHSP